MGFFLSYFLWLMLCDPDVSATWRNFIINKCTFLPQINKTAWQTVVFALYTYIWVCFSSFPRTKTQGVSHCTGEKKKVQIHVSTWANHENIMPSERRQSPKATHCMILFMWNTRNWQIHRDRAQVNGYEGLRGGGYEKKLLHGCRVFMLEGWECFGTRWR